jgi:2-polyprenyl-6-methoxyphenol hydroxylase-like FAD-dependent oxidoreductase
MPFIAAKFTVFEGLGECYWTPYFHKDGKPLWNLVFEAKPGTPYDRFQGARSGEELLAISKDVIREMMPWDAAWIDNATLADENSWLVGNITPTVRDPVAATASGRPIIPLGDAYIAYDPLGAQGANIGNRLAKTLVEAIVAHEDKPFDEAWVRATYEPFYRRWAEPSMKWTHFLLGPMRIPARYFLLAQQGADGSHTLGTPKQRLADAFSANFDDPIQLLDKLGDFSSARRWVLDTLGPAGDWEAAKGLFKVIGRQLH